MIDNLWWYLNWAYIDVDDNMCVQVMILFYLSPPITGGNVMF